MEVKPGYKQTEVGVIPADWEAAHIGDVCSFSGGSQPPRSTFKFAPTPGYIRLIQIRDYKSDDFASYIPEPLARKRCTSEDIMIGRYGPPLFQILRGIEGAYNVALIKTTPTPKVDREFFFSVLNQEPLFQLIEALSRRSSGQTGVEMPALKAYGLPLPPLPEQRAIATALSDVDGLLGGLDRLIAKKRDLKQAAMQQLLTGQTRLPGFHGEWEAAQVQDVIAGFFCGPSPTCDERNIHDDEWGVLKTTAATKEHGWDWTKHKTLPRVFWNKPQIELKKGDVIVTKAGPRHRVGVTAWIDYVPPRIIPSGKMIALRPRPDKVVPLMLAAAISARDAQVYLDQRTTGMAESQVNFENAALLEAPITIPRIEEQTAIASVLSEMDGELAVLEQRREKTRALKQAMMQELLTGQTRLV